jgi:Derlin-2/3
MEFEQFYNSLPKFSRFYMITVFVVTFCISYVRFVPVAYWTVLDLDLVVEKFQIWRLITNFFVIGKFSFNFLFFMMMV